MRTKLLIKQIYDRSIEMKRRFLEIKIQAIRVNIYV